MRRISKKQSRRAYTLSKIKRPENDICEKCGKVDHWRLQRHHKVFRSQGRDDSRSNIIWLCGECSDREHGIIRGVNE